MRYGAKVLFDEVSTAFTPGKRYGLTGPNGAGKSTFMKLLTGELEPQKGTVVRPRKFGVLQPGPVRLRRLSRDRHRHHGQQAPVGRDGRARAHLCQAGVDQRRRHAAGRVGRHRRRRGWLLRRHRCRLLLQGLDLPDELHERKMGELQGGQKVRVLLAQALFGHPQALLLDEPTNHLDLDSIHWLQNFLNNYDGVADRDLARPPFPEQRLHPYRRHRLRDDHHLHRQL